MFKKKIEKKFPKIKEKKIFKKSLFKIAKNCSWRFNKPIFITKFSLKKVLNLLMLFWLFWFDYTISSNDLQNIPNNRKVVIIANHPLGGLMLYVY